jgi:hypothetical protein
MKRCAMITLAAFGALLASAPSAPAQSPPDVSCPPYTGASTLTVHNVTVPDNGFCLLANVTVTGNVKVGPAASLEFFAGTISGNVQANNCNGVFLAKSTVSGGVQIGNCGVGGVDFSTVGGNLQCQNNTLCRVDSSTILGNLQIMNNTTRGPSEIFGNTIAKNLLCQNNSPPPTGSGNTVSGNPDQNSEGQCKGF